MFSGPKKISQVKVCHLVTDLMQNIVARLVENASANDVICFSVCIVRCWGIIYRKPGLAMQSQLWSIKLCFMIALPMTFLVAFLLELSSMIMPPGSHGEKVRNRKEKLTPRLERGEGRLTRDLKILPLLVSYCGQPQTGGWKDKTKYYR